MNITSFKSYVPQFSPFISPPPPSSQVMKAKFGVVTILVQRAGVFGKKSTSNVLPPLVEKIADVKVGKRGGGGRRGRGPGREGRWTEGGRVEGEGEVLLWAVRTQH